MAIRFVDVEPGKSEGAEPAPHRRARGSDPARPRPEPVAGQPPAGTDPSAADAVLDEAALGEAASGDAALDDAAASASPMPVLPHAKPEPKPRGRRKPMSAVGADKPKEKAPAIPSAPLLEGLVPEFQAHAKPTPKPRGRKKAFG